MKDFLSTLTRLLLLLGILLSCTCCTKSTPTYDTTTFDGIEDTLLWKNCKVTHMDNAELTRLQEAQKAAHGLNYREAFVRGLYGKTTDSESQNVVCIETINEEDAALLYQSLIENTSYYVLRRGCLVTYSNREYVINWL